jgi:LysM repeat protein
MKVLRRIPPLPLGIAIGVVLMGIFALVLFGGRGLAHAGQQVPEVAFDPTPFAATETPPASAADAAGARPPLPTSTPVPAVVPTVVHVVQPGENLFRIALQYGITQDVLADANTLDNRNTLEAGQELIVPLSGLSTLPPPAEGVGPTPTPYYEVRALNGIPLERIVIFPAERREAMARIYQRGQELGRDPRRFSKLGDSTIEHPLFLAPFGTRAYNLGAYGYLQPVIDHYAGSYARESLAVRRGLNSWTAMDPLWAPDACYQGEHTLACELRAHNPSVIVIRIGTNDVGNPEYFEENMRDLLAYTLEQGVIPILGTKADRFEDAGNVNNRILRTLAAEYQVPLWDFDVVADTLPRRGLGDDDVHLTLYYENDYTRDEAFSRGHAMHNLTALMVLDAVWREVIPTP